MKIAWIGTGVMGQSMAAHLIDAGHDLKVYNRSPKKASCLLDKGAILCDSPLESAQDSEIVFTIVGYPRDVEEVYFSDQGILKTSDPDILVDMTTSRPSLAKEIYYAAQALDIESLDAPVSGGDIGAKNAKLAIMVGGNETAFNQAKPLFDLMGENICLMGPAGSGQNTKMANQILIAGTMIGVCESLLYASKQGLDQQAVIDIIGKGAAGSWSINNLGPRIVKNDFAPGFYVEHFIKDMGIAIEESAKLELSLPGLILVQELYKKIAANGHARSGTQALIFALRQLNGEE